MAAVLSLVAAGAVVGGCSSNDRTSAGAVSRPLPFDPTEKYELSEWWTNGQMMVRLRSDLAYEIYAGVNRYRAPIERGQWRQRNYARLEFRPYAPFAQRVEQVLLDKDSKGNLVMIIEDMVPLGPIMSPPEVLEDFLIGSWSDESILIDLSAQGRYSHDRLATLRPGSSGVSGHRGTWILEGLTLTLNPDPPGLPPMVFAVVVVDDSIAIEGLARVGE